MLSRLFMTVVLRATSTQAGETTWLTKPVTLLCTLLRDLLFNKLAVVEILTRKSFHSHLCHLKIIQLMAEALIILPTEVVLIILQTEVVLIIQPMEATQLMEVVLTIALMEVVLMVDNLETIALMVVAQMEEALIIVQMVELKQKQKKLKT